MPKINMTADDVADKHARRLKGAIDDIRNGVSKVTESPTAKAAKRVDKMVAGIQAAASSGKIANRLNSVTLQEWQDKTINKGLPRIATGIDGARDKVVDFYNQLLPFEQSLSDQVGKMPDLTIEDSISRVTTWIRGMAKFQRK